MTKVRKGVPERIRGAVLGEYRHRCAICGAERPQLHHIDEDPSNNDPYNLLPLCPNCHLSDQHGPGTSLDSERLRVFRRHKDPTILLPQFLPLFRRAAFLLDVAPGDGPTEELERGAQDLVSFVEALEMGGVYAQKIGQLIRKRPRVVAWVVGDPLTEAREHEASRRYQELYRKQLQDHAHQVMELIVELLCYQRWSVREARGSGQRT